MKASNRQKLFKNISFIDDFANDPACTGQSSLLHSRSTRGRHNSISAIASTQLVHPVIKVNATSITAYRVRNNRELNNFLDEVSGLTGKKELLSIYKVATEDEVCFLYVNLLARKVSEMFCNNFTGRVASAVVSKG